jgi:hypothetical protein
MVWSGVAGHPAVAGAAGPDAAGGPGGPGRVRKCCWWPYAAQPRRVTFRCGRGRSNERSGANGCRRSGPVTGSAHDSDRYSKLNTALARGKWP